MGWKILEFLVNAALVVITTAGTGICGLTCVQCWSKGEVSSFVILGIGTIVMAIMAGQAIREGIRGSGVSDLSGK